MEDNGIKNDSLIVDEKEKELKRVCKKIWMVLDKRDNTNKEYDELVDCKIKIEDDIKRKNRRYIALGKFSLIKSIVFKILVGGILFLIVGQFFEIFKLLLSMYCIASGIAIVLVGGYQIYSYKKVFAKDKYLSIDLEGISEYEEVLRQIKDKERDIKYLDMEYDKLASERDNLISEIDLLLENTGDDRVVGEKMDEMMVYDDGVGMVVDEGKKNGLVRRRSMRDEMNKKKGRM